MLEDRENPKRASNDAPTFGPDFGCITLEQIVCNLRFKQGVHFDRLKTSSLLVPEFCQEQIDSAHRARGWQWSYTPYGENRRNAWKGSYLEDNQAWIHAGIDVNLPQGTPVTSRVPLKHIRDDDDKEQNGGWGPRVFAEVLSGPLKGQVAIFAHLQRIQIPARGQIKAGEPFAEIGGPPDNGNWYPHLHLQTLIKDLFTSALKADPLKLSAIDGYFPEREAGHYRKLYADPIDLMARQWQIPKAQPTTY